MVFLDASRCLQTPRFSTVLFGHLDVVKRSAYHVINEASSPLIARSKRFSALPKNSCHRALVAAGRLHNGKRGPSGYSKDPGVYEQCGGAFVHWEPGRRTGILIDISLSRVQACDQLDACVALAANKCLVLFLPDALASWDACLAMTLGPTRCCAAILLEKHRKYTWDRTRSTPSSPGSAHWPRAWCGEGHTAVLPVHLPTPGSLARRRQAPPRSLYCCGRRTERYRVRQVTIACATSLRRCVQYVCNRTRTIDICMACCNRDQGIVCQLASEDVLWRQAKWCPVVQAHSG